jgi:ABC-type transporter Mla subunit MlaD
LVYRKTKVDEVSDKDVPMDLDDIIKSILELKKMLEDMGFEESAEDLLKVSCKTLRNQIRKLMDGKESELNKITREMGSNASATEDIKLAAGAKSKEIDDEINELKIQLQEIGCT